MKPADELSLAGIALYNATRRRELLKKKTLNRLN